MSEFQKLDTSVIQVRSVLNFMYALGYTLDTKSKSGRFVTELSGLQGNRYLSADTAVKLHNLTSNQWDVYQEVNVAVPQGVSFQSGFNPLGVSIAIASKLVQKAKFSVNKHGQINVKDVMVKPLNKAVLDLIEPQA